MNNYPGTLITVSLDKLRAFDLNPRVIRNPDFDDIKASIKKQGLKLPLQITQRPGEAHYIIACGGNTRLAILNELWLETHDKKYWNITCIFYPWQTEKSVDEGNLHCLLGHLIENEMRGSLTFIERALGIQRTKELYTASGKHLSQAQLASQLCDDGFPVAQSSISKIESALEFLLPHIPDVLYGGLSRRNVEKILLLRTSAEQFWHPHSADRTDLPAFSDIFALALHPSNGPPASFSLEHLQDELAGLISQALGINYNNVMLAIDSRTQKRHALLGPATPTLPPVEQQRAYQPSQEEKKPASQNDGAVIPATPPPPDSPGLADDEAPAPHHSPPSGADDIPPRSASLSPATNLTPDLIWPIDPLIDTPEHLASVADQLAWELACEVGLACLISPNEQKGFELAEPEVPITDEARLYFRLLAFLSGKMIGSATVWHQLLIGSPARSADLHDSTLIPLFRLIRTLRRLHEKQEQGDAP